MLDVLRPLFQELDVLEVMRFAQGTLVEFFEALAGESLVGGAALFDSVGEQAAHRGGGTGEIGVGEIEADTRGGAADRQPVIDQLRQLAEAATTNDLRAVGDGAAVVCPAPDFGQALEPLHETVVVAAELFTEIVERQNEAEREAGLIRIEEPAHVEIGGAIVEGAVAQEDFERGALARRQLEDVFEVIRIDLDDFLDALKKMRRAGFSRAFVAFLRNEVRGVAFGEKDDIGVNRATVGVHADDVVVVIAQQSIHSGFRQNVRAERLGELGKIMVIGRAQDSVAVGEGGGIAVIEADERLAVIDVEDTLGDGTFVGRVADRLFAEDVGLGEVFREIDGARPILRARENAGLDDEHGDVGFCQRDGRGDAGRSRAYDHHVVFPGSHARIIRSPFHLESPTGKYRTPAGTLVE